MFVLLLDSSLLLKIFKKKVTLQKSFYCTWEEDEAE